MNEIDVTGLDKAEILVALYNHARPLGLGILNYTPEKMTPEEARSILDESTRPNGDIQFDYVRGRPIKVGFRGDLLVWPAAYDRDNGQGACRRIVDDIRQKVRP